MGSVKNGPLSVKASTAIIAQGAVLYGITDLRPPRQ